MNIPLPPSLRDRAWATFVAGNFFALQGLWAQRAIIGWLAWELSGSAGWVGLIAFFAFAPMLVAGPVFGVIADRAELRRAALTTQSLQLMVSLSLWIVMISDLLSLPVLAALALAQGLVASAHQPIRLSLTPRLAPRAYLANAIAVSSLNFNFARLTGPAAGGYAIAHFGAATSQITATLMFTPVILAIAVIRPHEREGPPARREGLWRSLREGVIYSWANRPVRYAMLLVMVFAIAVRGFLELLPVIADGVFSRGPAGLGELMSAAGIGALLAAIWLAGSGTVQEREGRGPAPPARVFAALYGGPVALAGIALSPYWPLTLALVGFAGFCSTLVGVTMQSIVQLSVDDAHRGRVMSLWIMVGVGSASLGSPALGAVADLAGEGPALIIASLAALLAVWAVLRKQGGW